MKKAILTLIIFAVAGLVAAEAATGYARDYFFKTDVKLPISRGQYAVREIKGDVSTASFKLPDLSRYTYQEVQKRKPASTQNGIVVVEPIEDIIELTKFTEQTYEPIMYGLQGEDDPIGIVIRSGIYTLPMLYKELANPNLIDFKDGAYYVYVPVAVGAAATFIIEGTEDEPMTLRLSSVKGGFLINAGKTFIIHADIAGWDEQEDDYAYYQGRKKFRPFLASWNGSTSYYVRSSFRHLGFSASKSYGITFSTDKTLNKLPVPPPPPTGWIIESYFEGLLYAFYSYEAKGIVAVHNEYANNIVYAIDPHDRSSKLIFAHNKIHGTKEKHGIIGSRSVDDSWFFNNHTYNNKGSGIMLDRSCLRNVIANNIVEWNGNDGITLFESPNNIIRNNIVRFNGKSGLRLRNSWNVHSVNNQYYLNKGVALQIYTLDISNNPDRDLEEDPFSVRADITSIEDMVLLNWAGEIKFYDFDYARIKGMRMLFARESAYREDMGKFREIMTPILRASADGIEIRRKASAGRINPDQWQPSAFDKEVAVTLKTHTETADRDSEEDSDSN